MSTEIKLGVSIIIQILTSKISGFGRIGRLLLRAAIQNENGPLVVVAINDPFLSPDEMAYLLRFDSVHGKFKGTIKIENNILYINSWKIQIYHERNPELIKWANQETDIVVDATSIFTTVEQASRHLHKEGAKKVIIAAPSKDAPVYIMGVNEKYYKNEKVISNASAATNAASLLASIIHENFGVIEGFVNVIHAVTNVQKTVDGPSQASDVKRGRASRNIIPIQTGTFKTIGKVIPALDGKLAGNEIRVPIQDVSCLNITLKLTREVFREDVEPVLENAAKALKGIFSVTQEDVVSSDFITSKYTCIYDSKASHYLRNTVRLVAWFDNEWGFVNRLLDLAEHISKI